MITRFKIFENINDGEPKVGDFVIIKTKDLPQLYNFYGDFIKTSIGRIWKIHSVNFFLIKYENIPKEIKDYFSYSDYSKGLNIGNSILVHKRDIIYWSKNKEDLDYIIDAKKFNI